MAKYIYWLKDIEQSDKPAVGGKGTNLGDMARGLLVPPGFCLSSSAYHDNISHFRLYEKIEEILKDANLNELQEAERVSEDISRIIIETPMLPEIENALVSAYNKLAEEKVDIMVAVRSSATAEDLEDASFAGQQETFLNVTGISDVLLSVKKCWASLWTPRAIHYRSQRGFVHSSVKMAVIIQEMVPATVAGVMFTANPVTNSRKEIRIDAVRGLGEQLVSGHTAGDVYILNKSETNVEIKSREIYDQSKGQMLTDYELRELAHTGLKIEVYYDNYMDIEWAYHKGKFYFLQARPITTLADEDLPEINFKKMNNLQKELYDWAAERFPEPIYPVDSIVVKLLFMAQFEAMQEFGFTIEDMDWSRIEKGIFPEFFDPPRISAGLGRILPYFHLGRTLKSDPAGEWAKEQVHLSDMLKRLKGRDMSSLPYELLTDYISEAFNHWHFFTVMRYRYFAQNRVPALLLRKFLKFLFKDQGNNVYENLLAGSDNITLEINRALYSLAQGARLYPAVQLVFSKNRPEEILEKLTSVEGGPDYLAKFKDFVQLYGERETSMGLGGIASPTWEDSPEVVAGIIKAILSEDPGMEEVRERARTEKVREAEKLLEKKLSGGIWALIPIRSILNKIVVHSRSFTVFRENSHYDVTRGLHVFRVLFTELGRRLQTRGILHAPSDVIYLTYSEIKEIIATIYFGIEELNVKAIAQKIRARKEEQVRRLNRWKLRNVKIDETGAIKGVPASQGIVSGAVKVIREPGDFYKLCKGDILVAPYTNPAWTPLFTTAAGLIVETGGVASHAAIIAREYGLPAVMGVAQATEIFKDGEIITVNGATGSIIRDKK